MPQPKRKQRRVNPDKAPWAKYPLIVWTPNPNAPEAEPIDWDQWIDDVNVELDNPTPYDPEKKAAITGGTITLTCGTFDTADLPDRCLRRMKGHPGEEYVTTTDGLSRIDVTRGGTLVDAKLSTVPRSLRGPVMLAAMPGHRTPATPPRRAWLRVVPSRCRRPWKLPARR